MWSALGGIVLEIRVLGPVSAVVEGGSVAIAGRLGRTVLAALALATGHVVTVDSLIDALWGDRPPATAREQVHNQVSRLRRAFKQAGACGVILTDTDGYRLGTKHVVVDLADVMALFSAARAAQDHGQADQAADLMRTALERWKGSPLGGVTIYLADAERGHLSELRLTVLEQCLEAELAAGHAEDLVPELTALVRLHPLDERLHRLRMLALYHADRRADALIEFQEARRILRDELGMDPPRALRDLEAQILRSG